MLSLARATSATPGRVRRRPKRATVRPSVLRVIEGLHDQPAYVRNHRSDILAAHPLARALPSEVEQEPANTCRFVLLDPRATRMYPEWERVAAAESGCCGLRSPRTPTTVGCRT